MPEGDSLHRAARRLQVLVGERVEIEAPHPRAAVKGLVERHGGSVIVSSHSMDLVQRMCDHVAVIAAGRVLAAGTIDEVRAGDSLQDRFVSLVGGRHRSEGPQWLRQS